MDSLGECVNFVQGGEFFGGTGSFVDGLDDFIDEAIEAEEGMFAVEGGGFLSEVFEG